MCMFSAWRIWHRCIWRLDAFSQRCIQPDASGYRCVQLHASTQTRPWMHLSIPLWSSMEIISAWIISDRWLDAWIYGIRYVEKINGLYKHNNHSWVGYHFSCYCFVYEKVVIECLFFLFFCTWIPWVRKQKPLLWIASFHLKFNLCESTKQTHQKTKYQ